MNIFRNASNKHSNVDHFDAVKSFDRDADVSKQKVMITRW